MDQHGKQPCQKPEKTKPCADSDKKELEQPECRCKLLIRYGKRTQRRKRDHNHDNRTHQICLHGCLPDDQSPHNSNRIPHRSGQPHSRLPQQFKRKLHDNHLNHRRKRHAAPGVRKGQQERGRQNLCVEIGDRQIESRQCHGKKGCKIAQKALKACDLPAVIVIVARLDKGIVIGRQNERDRRIVRQHNHSAVKDGHCRPVRPFRRLKLWKRGIPFFLRQLFNDSAVEYPVNLKSLQPLLNLCHQLRVGDPFHIDQIDVGVGAHAHFFLFYLDLWRPDSLADQRRILFYRIPESLVRTTHHFFRVRLVDAHIRITVIRNLDRFRKTVDEKNGFSGQKTVPRLLDRRKIGRIGGSEGILFQHPQNLLPLQTP